ncbi:hypothetical protein LTS10_005334 [Elasticomyces elasticus]|nr:hypothetical protein LTS10_005334 [Elasticomyces elasticus]
MDFSYEQPDLRSVEERLRVVRLQLEEAKLMEMMQHFHDAPNSDRTVTSQSERAAPVLAQNHNTLRSSTQDFAIDSQPTIRLSDVLMSTTLNAVQNASLDNFDSYADLESCIATLNHTETADLQPDLMATVEPTYTSLSQNWDDYEQQPIDWSWLTDFTAEQSTPMQRGLPGDRAGVLNGVDYQEHPSAKTPTVAVTFDVELRQPVHTLPEPIQHRVRKPFEEKLALVSVELRDKGRDVLQDYPLNPKRRKTSNIPGYSCFSIMPEGAKSRRQTSRASQERITKLRKRGACMLCRIKNVRYLRNTEFSYLTTIKPHWSRWATGRPEEYDSFKCVKLLTIAYTVNHKASQLESSTSPEVSPSTWSHVASDVLGLVDGFIRRKKCWEDRNSTLILTATMDLLMGICHDMALHIQELSDCYIVSEDARIYSALIERCKFCVHRVMTFRKIVLKRLGTTESSYLEEAAFATLSKVTPRSPVIGNAMEILHDIIRSSECPRDKSPFLVKTVPSDRSSTRRLLELRAMATRLASKSTAPTSVLTFRRH